MEVPNILLFDRDAALERLGGDDALLEELLGLLIEESHEVLQRIRDGFARGDAMAVCIAAHTIKGSAATLEAGPLRDAAEHLEDLARRGDLGGGDDAFAALVLELERLGREIGA